MNGNRSKLGFVQLGGEAKGFDHGYDAGRWNILRFAVWRGVLINVPVPELEADGSDRVTECEAGFSIPGGGVRDGVLASRSPAQSETRL